MEEHIKTVWSKILLATGTGSWGAYEAFKAGSEFCRMVLPYLGVISFAVTIIINWDKIKKFFFNDKA